MQETQIQSLGQKDPLEEEMATHNFLPGEFHGQRSYSPWGHKQLDTTEHYSSSAISVHMLYAVVIEVKMGNGYYVNQ